MSKPDLDAACAALIEAGRRLDARGHAAATSGNYSVRLGDGSIAITRSGRHKGRLDASGIMRLAGDGAPIDEGRPSAETGLHLMVYRLFPDAGAVLHWHSPQAVGFSRALRGRSGFSFSGHEMLKAYPGVATHATSRSLPIVDNSQDMAEIESEAAPLLAAPDAMPAFLIRDHGLYAWGQDMESAERVLEATEWLIAAELAERGFRNGAGR